MAADFLERMGGRIRERREALGLSRAELARQMSGKVNENQIYRWELGKHQPNPDTLEELATLLGCDVGYLMAPPQPESASRVGTPDLFAGNGDAMTHVLARLEAQDAILADIRRQLGEVVRGTGELSELDREVLARFEELMQRLGRDVGRGQPRSRGKRSILPEAPEHAA